VSNYENNPFYRAVKFPGEREAGAVYFKIQALIHPPECDLSAYRFLIQNIWHVAIVGDIPNGELAEKLERHLSGGARVDLPDEIIDFLRGRRQQQIEHGPWVEHHHRPGRRFRLDRELVTDPNEGNIQWLFPLGRVVMTTSLQAKLQEANPERWEAELIGLISRHAACDWGDLDEYDKRQNDLALSRELRIFSAYKTASDVKIWVITEADRSVTTLLLPEDY